MGECWLLSVIVTILYRTVLPIVTRLTCEKLGNANG